MREFTVFALGVLTAAASTSASAQISARQGVPETPPAEQEILIDSPMVLDLPLRPLVDLASGSTIHVGSVRQYVCDGNVSFSGLAVAKLVPASMKNRRTEVVLSGLVLVSPSHDRSVDIGAKLRVGQEELAAGSLHGLEAEEKHSTVFRIPLSFDESRLRTDQIEATPPVLELTLTVHDD